jgi:hypothetical protein
LRWWRFRSLRKPKELSAAHKKAPKRADVPLGLSVLLWEVLSALPPVLLAEY